jgi:hypothetical protein
MRPFFFLPLVLAAPARASTAVQMDVPALTRAASDVVRARAVSTRCAWTEDHRRLVTFVEMEVLEAWKGPAPARLTVLQPGGEREGVGQRVEGVTPLVVGEEVVLFLEHQGPIHRVVGLSQGVYRVVRTAEASAARAVPADVRGLALVSAPGRAGEPRAPVLLEGLRESVRQEVERE